jgi:plasmid stability protein
MAVSSTEPFNHSTARGGAGCGPNAINTTLLLKDRRPFDSPFIGFYACNAGIEYTEPIMATLTIRNLDETIKAGLRLRAASHGRSMEEEARQILKQAVQASAAETGLGTRIHGRFAAIGGAALSLPERMPVRPSPDFSDTDNL